MHLLQKVTIIAVIMIIGFGHAAFAKTLAYGTRFYNRYCGLTIGLDPYESYVSVFCNLRTKPPQPIAAQSELEFYWLLFLKSFQPFYFLVQGTEYPLTHGTALFKQEIPGRYHQLDWNIADSTRLNVLEILGSGYREPYALSFFVGYLTPFWSNESGQKKQAGSASSGFVVTFGDRHIRNFNILKDNWYEIKWSLKGDQDTKDRFLKWNVQAGKKIHDHPELMNAWFFRLYRDHLNKNYCNVFSLQNTSLECRAEMPVQDLAVITHAQDAFSLLYLDAGKKFPSRRWKRIVYTVNAGISWEKYNDLVKVNKYIESLSFFVRPNIIF